MSTETIRRLQRLERRLSLRDADMALYLEQVPLVMWAKRYRGQGFGEYIFITGEYGRVYNIDPASVIGKRDDQIWPEHIAEGFRVNDLMVLESGEMLTATEQVQDDETKDWSVVSVIKFPVCDPGEDHHHCQIVGGIAFSDRVQQKFLNLLEDV